MAEQKIITKKWTLEEIDLLINLIRENPELYEGCYQRIEVVEKCWQAIADAIQTKNVKLCKAKWQVLRGGYRIRRSGEKGSKKWPYYESLSFLDNYITQRNIVEKFNIPEHNDDYFETVILNSNIDYDECSPIIIEDDTTSECYPTSVNTARKSKKRGTSPVEIDEELTHCSINKKSKSSVHLFLQSMEEDIAKLSPKGLRNFKRDVLETLDKYLEAEGKDRI